MKKSLLITAAAIAGLLASAPQAQQNDDGQTIAQSTQTLQYNPRDYDARFKRGEAYFRQGKYDAAIADFDTLLDSAQTPLLYYKRGETYHHRKKGNDNRLAIADFTSALAIDDKQTYSYFVRAQAYRDVGEPTKAIADFSSAINLEPTNVWFYNFRGEANYAAGNYQRAINDWNKAMKLGFDDSLKKRVKAAKAKM